MEGLFGWKDPLFVGLWHSSWQASVLIGLVLLLQWSFGNKLSPGWRYGLWLLVVVRLALPVTPESPLSIFNVSIFDGMRFSRPGTPSFENFTATPIVSPVTSKHQTPHTCVATFRKAHSLSPSKPQFVSELDVQTDTDVDFVSLDPGCLVAGGSDLLSKCAVCKPREVQSPRSRIRVD